LSASSQAEDCSSAAEAMVSEPFCASTAAFSLSMEYFRMSSEPLTTSTIEARTASSWTVISLPLTT